VSQLEQLQSVDYLQKALKGVRFSVIHELGGALQTVRYRPEELIFTQGQSADRFYLVKKGRIGLTTSIDIRHVRRIPTVSDYLGYI
jgi:CRP-like cAMP-binding protein